MKNANPRYTSRRLRRGGGERKSTKKYLAMRRKMASEWSPHRPDLSTNELIAAGHTPIYKDEPPILRGGLWINIDKRAFRRRKRSGKICSDYYSHML